MYNLEYFDWFLLHVHAAPEPICDPHLKLITTTMSANVEIAIPLPLDNVVEPAYVSAPIPMSFPAVLRNPKLTDRFAHLRISASGTRDITPVQPKKNSREDREGKRWVRRRENGWYIELTIYMLLITVLCSPLCWKSAHRRSVQGRFLFDLS